jgi:Cu/Ag efflux protein CusF
MNSLKYIRFITVIGLTLCMSIPFVAAQQGEKSTQKGAGKKEFTFRGKVEKVDPQTKTLTINGEEVKGWMAAMTMGYRVDNDAVFKQVKVGDTITAKVYEGDLVLHDVRVVPPSAGSGKNAEKGTPKK